MDEFSNDEVLQQAKSNAEALGVVTMAYLQAKGLPVDDYWRFVSDKFTWGWDSVQGKGALAAMRLFALNMVSVGGTLESVSGDEARAEAVVSSWPSPDMLEAFGVDKADADHAYAVFDAIATFLGLDYAWRRQGERVTLTLTK
ncbi:MAG: hypothetical protein P8Y13_12675 [Deinococcales bacterium]